MDRNVWSHAKVCDLLARLVLNKVGFDATDGDCEDFLRCVSDEIRVSGVFLQGQQRYWRDADPGKSYYTKADIQYQQATDLVRTADGRKAFRTAIKRATKEQILELLGFDGTETR